MKRLDQSGSHVMAVAVLVLALAMVGYAGYKVQQSHNKANDQTASVKATVPGTISSSSDLNQTDKVLDNSSSELDTSLDDSSMNADLNSML